VDCFLCGKPLGKNRRSSDDHHVIPRRYFKKFPGENPDIGNIARVHVTCHRLLHQTVDRPRMPLKEFVAYMETLDWCHYIFADQQQAA
jgi:hypothetical protein